MPYFSHKINPDAHFGTKINTFTFYKGVLGGNSPQKPKKCKNGGLTFFIPGAKIYPVMMSIQIHARGGGVQIFFIKMVQFGAFRVFPNTLLST